MASNMAKDTRRSEDTTSERKTFKCFQCSFECSDKNDLHLHMRDVQCYLGIEGNVSDRDKLKTLREEYTVKDTAQLFYSSMACRIGRTPSVTSKTIGTNHRVTEKQANERYINIGKDAVGTSNPTKCKVVYERCKQNLCGGNVASEGTNIPQMTPMPTSKTQRLTVNARHADKLRRVLQQQGIRDRFTSMLRIKMRKKLMELGITKQSPVVVKKRKLAVEEKKKQLEIPEKQQVLPHGSIHITARDQHNATGVHGFGSKRPATAEEDAMGHRRPSFPQGNGTVSSSVPIDLRVKRTTTQSSTTTRHEELDLHRMRPPSLPNRAETGRTQHSGHHDMNNIKYVRQRSLSQALREVERCLCRDCRPVFLTGVQTIDRCHAELRRETQSRRLTNQ
ncbi:uncharacterized protein LOC118429197 [Branchiostoma floridae]|uniref:Uncharacterized protein LOC118429197 n=1 Tax=Branchiostoma floridae TaxID=7739 RepID=A0A9J7M7B3_BRAFL|nr:uncharacterized protein LOC118429197 [Branchiostoma floridae]XP_035695552.1 uncharacterized protein LOC118429197 [Branchiostoma floridae]